MLIGIYNLSFLYVSFQLVTSDTSSVSDTGRDDQQSVISGTSDLHPPMPRTVGIGDSRPPSFQYVTQLFDHATIFLLTILVKVWFLPKSKSVALFT